MRSDDLGGFGSDKKRIFENRFITSKANADYVGGEGETELCLLRPVASTTSDCPKIYILIKILAFFGGSFK